MQNFTLTNDPWKWGICATYNLSIYQIYWPVCYRLIVSEKYIKHEKLNIVQGTMKKCWCLDNLVNPARQTCTSCTHSVVALLFLRNNPSNKNLCIVEWTMTLRSMSNEPSQTDIYFTFTSYKVNILLICLINF